MHFVTFEADAVLLAESQDGTSAPGTSRGGRCLILMFPFFVLGMIEHFWRRSEIKNEEVTVLINQEVGQEPSVLEVVIRIKLSSMTALLEVRGVMPLQGGNLEQVIRAFAPQKFLTVLIGAYPIPALLQQGVVANLTHLRKSFVARSYAFVSRLPEEA